MQDSYLQHHGIKGMRWGVRRFENEDGTLTPAGKRRYADDSSGPKKSKHRQKLEAKYREKGMTEKDAEAAAAKRIRIEKVIGVTAGLTVAAASAYVIGKNIKERTDGIVKSGTKIQVIANDPNKDLERPFYMAYKKSDTTKYAGLYGNQLGADNAYRISLQADKDIKVVSRKKAADVFADLYKNDPEFRKSFDKSNDVMNPIFGQAKVQRLHEAASKEMSDRKLRRVGYDAFNRGLVNHDEDGNKIAKKFYDRLKAMGYDAVEDINDQKYSGYNSKKPVIIFNKANKISVQGATKLTEEQVASYAKKSYKMLLGDFATKELAAKGAIFAGTVGGLSIMNASVNNMRVNNYRAQHPGTNMTDQEILRMLASA